MGPSGSAHTGGGVGTDDEVDEVGVVVVDEPPSAGWVVVVDVGAGAAVVLVVEGGTAVVVVEEAAGSSSWADTDGVAVAIIASATTSPAAVLRRVRRLGCPPCAEQELTVRFICCVHRLISTPT
ncbi:MAG: hypothetical protein R2733_25345 [Acidimicrobiales bacterium]